MTHCTAAQFGAINSSKRACCSQDDQTSRLQDDDLPVDDSSLWHPGWDTLSTEHAELPPLKRQRMQQMLMLYQSLRLGVMTALDAHASKQGQERQRSRDIALKHPLRGDGNGGTHFSPTLSPSLCSTRAKNTPTLSPKKAHMLPWLSLANTK